MDSATLISYLRQQRIMNYVVVSCAAVSAYDYALTLHLEIKYIWFSRWNYTKVLFLLTRYMTMVIMIFLIYDGLVSDVSVEICKINWHFVSWLILLKVICAETILCVRTWAMWNRDKVVGIVLVTTMLVYFASQCFLMDRFLLSLQFLPPPFTGFRGCFIVKVNRLWLWTQYASLLVVLTLVLILVVISASRLYRTGRNTDLSFIVHRDGIVFYVYILFLAGANTILALVATLNLVYLIIPLEVVMHSVFTMRIVLNIRRVASRGQKAELHTSYSEMGSKSQHLRFAPAGEHPSDRRVPDEFELANNDDEDRGCSIYLGPGAA